MNSFANKNSKNRQPLLFLSGKIVYSSHPCIPAEPKTTAETTLKQHTLKKRIPVIDCHPYRNANSVLPETDQKSNPNVNCQ